MSLIRFFCVISLFYIACICFFKMQNCAACKVRGKLENVTIVTALYDIGRGHWPRFRKKFEQFLSDFTFTLQLPANLVVFCDKSLSYFAKKHRCTGCPLHVIEMPYNKLEYFSYRPYLKHIMSTSEYEDGNLYLEHPEGFSADYIILMSNKISFLKISTEQNIFNSTHFFWLDAGYGHGNLNNDWRTHNRSKSPKNIFNLNNVITYISLNGISMYEGIYDLQKVDLPPAVAGGFFGGDQKSVLEYYHIYRKVFRGKLPDCVADDDQSYAVYSYFEIPRLFNLVQGDWYDAYKYL